MNSWSSRELEEASSSPLAMICVNSSGRGYQWGTTSRPINGQNKFHLPHHAGHKSVDVTSSSFVCGHPHRTVPYMFKRRGSIRVEVEVSVHWKPQIIRNLCLEIGDPKEVKSNPNLGLDLTSLPTLCICMVSAVWHETSSQCSSLQQGVKLVRKCKTISNSIYTLLCYVTKYSKRLFSTIQAENQKLLCENCFLLVNNNTMKFN